MHTAEIVILVVAGILGSAFMILAAISIVNNQASEKAHQEYIDSIKIGDTFGHNSFKFSDSDDPFSENHGTQGFDPYYYVTILDIKKNHKGKTWVKFCFTKNINNPYHGTWTDEINDFLKYRTRISRRIDNINTRED